MARRRRISLNNLAKVLIGTSVGVGIPLATLAQSYMDLLYPYIGWLAVGIYFFLSIFVPVLVPLGNWMRGIIEYIASFFESSPTPEATGIYIALTIIIIIVAVIVNMVKAKPAFVEELEAKYDHPPETVK